MDTRPTPLRARVTRQPKKLAILNLAWDEASAEACRRCQTCTAKPGPVEGEFVCEHEMPASEIHRFVWGTRLDRAIPASPPDRSATPGSGDDSCGDATIAELDDATIAELVDRVVEKLRSPGDYGFTAASHANITLLVDLVTFFFWTEDDWDDETQKPPESWPIHGGGRMWATVTKRGNKNYPILQFWPLQGPPARCENPYWIDFQTEVGRTPVIFRASVWPKGTTPDEKARYLNGKGRFAWLHIKDVIYIGHDAELWRLLNPRTSSSRK